MLSNVSLNAVVFLYIFVFFYFLKTSGVCPTGRTGALSRVFHAAFPLMARSVEQRRKAIKLDLRLLRHCATDTWRQVRSDTKLNLQV